MKAEVAAAVLASMGMASAFVATPFSGAQLTTARTTTTSSALKMAVNDVLGSDVETQGVWDPLGYSKDEGALFRYREAELKHGRVAMLATLGWFVAEVWHPLYDGKVEPGLKAIGEIPAAGWVQIIGAIAAIELTVGKQDYENKAPGELGNFGQAFNPFANNPERFAELQLKELKNGRLAQVAFAGLVAQDLVTGQSPLAQLAAGHISPFGDGQGYF